MILYPTETIYALGVNAFDATELAALYTMKGRDEGKPVSLLVRNIADIERFAVLPPRARAIAEAFLPGPLTLVLPAREETPRTPVFTDDTLSFRISPDQVAADLIAERIEQAGEQPYALTCTSANVSGAPTLGTPHEILEQLKAAGRDISGIEQVVDDGPRSGAPSTVVRVIGDEVTIHREGAIPASSIVAIV